MSEQYPQVVLFGSTQGNWREKHIIPALEKMGVTYFNPVATKWTTEMGKREAEYMEHAETIIMVFNNHTASFTGLAEAGWATLGAYQRGQTFILFVMQDEYREKVPFYLRWIPRVRELVDLVDYYAMSLRFLVQEHAAHVDSDKIHAVDSFDEMIKVLEAKYIKG